MLEERQLSLLAIGEDDYMVKLGGVIGFLDMARLNLALVLG